MVKNLPCNAGDRALIPGWGAKIPHAMGQLSPHTTTTEPAHARWNPCDTTSGPRATLGSPSPQQRPCMPQLRPEQ